MGVKKATSLGKDYIIEFLLTNYNEYGVYEATKEPFSWYMTLPPVKIKELNEHCRKLKLIREQYESNTSKQFDAIMKTLNTGKPPPGQKPPGSMMVP